MKREKTYQLLGEMKPLNRTKINWDQHRVFDGQKQYKLVTSIDLVRQHNEETLFDGPLQLDVTFYMETPKSKIRCTANQTPFAKKPDLDNLLKMLCDIGNKIIWRDDATITDIRAKKIYTDKEPKCIFTVKELI